MSIDYSIDYHKKLRSLVEDASKDARNNYSSYDEALADVAAELLAERDTLRALAQTLVTVLSKLEWEEELNIRSDRKYCSVCLRYFDYGHEDDCELAAALALATASGVVPK